jgi:hypothetical protein
MADEGRGGITSQMAMQVPVPDVPRPWMQALIRLVEWRQPQSIPKLLVESRLSGKVDAVDQLAVRVVGSPMDVFNSVGNYT